MIEIWRYELQARGALGKGGASRFEGALVRLDGIGHGCLHPWPALGDAPLEKQLRILAKGGETSLLRQTLRCARIDGEARRHGVSLLESLPALENHWQWRFECRPQDDALEVERHQFRFVKIKASNPSEADHRIEIVSAETGSDVRLRIDFNAQLEESEAIAWWQSLDQDTKARIDWIEDPICGSSPGAWIKLHAAGLPLAWDGFEAHAPDDLPYQIRILKPARSEDTPPLPTRIAYTSYLDHPLGQCWALWHAASVHAKMGPAVRPGGLASHPMFEPSDFSEQLKISLGGKLYPQPGLGFGFDDLLAKLAWQPLI